MEREEDEIGKIIFGPMEQLYDYSKYKIAILNIFHFLYIWMESSLFLLI